MSAELQAFAAIMAMAVVTYLTRVGGFWLMRFVPEGGFARRWLHHLPGSVVIAILAPMALQGGWAAPVAIIVAIGLGLLRASAIVATFGAVALVALLRQLL